MVGAPPFIEISVKFTRGVASSNKEIIAIIFFIIWSDVTYLKAITVTYYHTQHHNWVGECA